VRAHVVLTLHVTTVSTFRIRCRVKNFNSKKLYIIHTWHERQNRSKAWFWNKAAIWKDWSNTLEECGVRS